ncbi:MAG: hypothetical protein IT208_03445 [Chthonomonadales bacterium]|nr:hypothetical protein [Chthonomonadales bacterium]
MHPPDDSQCELLWRYIVDLKYADNAGAAALASRASRQDPQVAALAEVADAVHEARRAEAPDRQAAARAHLEALLRNDTARPPLPVSSALRAMAARGRWLTTAQRAALVLVGVVLLAGVAAALYVRSLAAAPPPCHAPAAAPTPVPVVARPPTATPAASRTGATAAASRGAGDPSCQP